MSYLDTTVINVRCVNWTNSLKVPNQPTCWFKDFRQCNNLLNLAYGPSSRPRRAHGFEVRPLFRKRTLLQWPNYWCT